MFGRATIRLCIGPHSSLLLKERDIAAFVSALRHHLFAYNTCCTACTVHVIYFTATPLKHCCKRNWNLFKTESCIQVHMYFAVCYRHICYIIRSLQYSVWLQCSAILRVTSRLVFTARLHPHFGMPPSFNRCMLLRRWFHQNMPLTIVLLQQCHCLNLHRGKLQNLSPPSVLLESSRIFFTIQETQTQKMMDQNFEIRIL